MSNTNRLIVLMSMLILAGTSSLYAQTNSNSVDNSERLAQINRATGASSGGSTTFENRMDAILSTTRSTERAYVVSQETTARQNAAVAAQEDQMEIARAQELNPDRYNPKKARDNTQVADSNAAKFLKQDGTEKAYLSARENIQKEFDERLKKASAQALEQRAADRTAANESTASPLLANNPFYVGEEKDPNQKNFEARKAVIISRLVERGIDTENATSTVGQATSEEDLIVNLMKDYDLSYGDASDATS